MRTALTIAGSDSVAGAGVQADLKTFAALGVYGVSAITAITSQSTTGVSHVVALSPELVRSQIVQVAEDIDIQAVKTGMLASRDIVQVVADALGNLRAPIVVDPVMAASRIHGEQGRTLLAREAVSVLKARLLPLAAVVTPNIDEATELSGVQVDSLGAAREAAKRILELGPRAVVVKGGHLAGEQAIDLLLFSGSFTEFPAARCPLGPVHGTGCTFASAIAARLAFGDDIPAAIERAKAYVTGAIAHSLEVGQGARLLNHFWERGLYS
jgi:hydroxymethylpyrimidine/phosphomethylpyrimidine kinase